MNESILRHPKIGYLWSITDCQRMNLGLLIEKEMTIRSKQIKTPVPFPVLITVLYRWARVPRDVKMDVEVTPTSYTEIWCNVVDKIWDEAGGRRVEPVNTSSDADFDMLPIEAIMDLQASGVILRKSKTCSRA